MTAAKSRWQPPIDNSIGSTSSRPRNTHLIFRACLSGHCPTKPASQQPDQAGSPVQRRRSEFWAAFLRKKLPSTTTGTRRPLRNKGKVFSRGRPGGAKRFKEAALSYHAMRFAYNESGAAAPHSKTRPRFDAHFGLPYCERRPTPLNRSSISKA